ncbi:hypothetical protein ACFQAS_10075 [Halopenitus salinus]|uniref:DUF2975 domain-containing protein n=1 Tax=Halopenitus salinus TaxID=1198295 RepID=A0ABD5US00_9EURY
MIRRFLAAKPLQACKLVAVVCILAIATLGFFRILPGQQLRVLLLVAFLGPVLALVVLAEALVAGYRTLRSEDDSPTDRLAARPAYTVVRAVEVVVPLLAGGAFAVLIATLSDEPMSGPGAIGLLFVGVGLGLLALVSILVRTLAEYVLHRRNLPRQRTDDVAS